MASCGVSSRQVLGHWGVVVVTLVVGTAARRATHRPRRPTSILTLRCCRTDLNREGAGHMRERREQQEGANAAAGPRRLTHKPMGPGRGQRDGGERRAEWRLRSIRQPGWGWPRSAPLTHQLMTTMDLCQAAARQQADSSFCSRCHIIEMAQARMTFTTSPASTRDPTVGRKKQSPTEAASPTLVPPRPPTPCCAGKRLCSPSPVTSGDIPVMTPLKPEPFMED